MSAAIQHLHPEPAIHAAGYVRVSRKVQAEGHSPETQREAIKKLAAQQGYILDTIEEDHERGSKITRKGYQAINQGVREGRYHAVLVFAFDRWGRDGAEWVERAQEFDRLHVPIISVMEGKSQRGPIRFFLAGMAQGYSEQLAEKIRPNREAAARLGTHCGPTPFGYLRGPAEVTPQGRVLPRPLHPDPERAWIVQELFCRYAAGGWTFRTLARWCNDDPRIGPTGRGALWMQGTVEQILKNVTYCGKVSYNQRPSGRYERAEPGTDFVVDGPHETLIDQATFDLVQEHMAGARVNQTHNRRTTHAGTPTAMGAGRFTCRCGGQMYRVVSAKPNGGTYRCLDRYSGKSDCAEPSYGVNPAHAALLRELRRLRCCGSFTLQHELAHLGFAGQDEVEAVEATRQLLEKKKEQLQKNAGALSLIEGDITPEVLAAFKAVGAKIGGEIHELEMKLATANQQAVRLPLLKQLYADLSRQDIGAVIDALEAQDDTVALRELVLKLVKTAVVVERYPVQSSRWLRVSVAWSDDVQALIDLRLVALDPPAPLPHFPSREEQIAAAQQRYNERRRAARRASKEVRS